MLRKTKYSMEGNNASSVFCLVFVGDVEVQRLIQILENLCWSYFQISEIVFDVLMSMFMNELYGFQLDNHRWYVHHILNVVFILFPKIN